MFRGLDLIIESILPDKQCFWGIICANEIFISIYGVIFTILISFGVYVYGLQDKTEKTALISISNISNVIKDSLIFFAFTFIALPEGLYQTVNFVLLIYLFKQIVIAFWQVRRFNENELSGEKVVREYKERIILEKLGSFKDNSARNKELNDLLKQRGVDRFVLNEHMASYDLIRANKKGYINDINIKNLFSNDTISKTPPLEQKNDKYYVPFDIAIGRRVKIDDILIGIKRQENNKPSLFLIEKMRSMISIIDDLDNPGDYLDAEIKGYFPKMFNFISSNNFKELELSLDELSKFVDLVITEPNNQVEIIESLNNDIIYPLQKHAFKCGDLDIIRTIVSFSLRYIYKSINENLNDSFKIFLRNLNVAFYQSFSLKDIGIRTNLQTTFFRWINELCKYSIQPQLEKGNTFYKNYAIGMLAIANDMLKLSYDKKDISTFRAVLNLVNTAFERDPYNFEMKFDIEEIIGFKKAVIFGFASWIYKNHAVNKANQFHIDVLKELFTVLSPTEIEAKNPINYYISLYIKTKDLFDNKSRDMDWTFGWESWGMPEGVVYTVTFREDLRNLLVDRMISVFVKNPKIKIEIDYGNYDQELSMMKKGGEFDPLVSRTTSSFVALSEIKDISFEVVKDFVYSLFNIISDKYDEDEKANLVKQTLDEDKFNKFGKENIKSYLDSRVLFKIGKFIKKSVPDKKFLGYNTILNKNQFVKETNVHYVHDDQFGTGLAKSEDNEILKNIFNKVAQKTIELSHLVDYIYNKLDFNFVVIWTRKNFDLNLYDQNKLFKPYWLEGRSEDGNGPYYKGRIGNKKVFVVYKTEGQENFEDVIFLFKTNSFSIEEHEPSVRKWKNELDILSLNITDDKSMHLEIKGLSNSNDDRGDIVTRWIKDKIINKGEEVSKNEDLKNKVVLRFYKSLNPDSIKVNEDGIEIIKPLP